MVSLPPKLHAVIGVRYEGDRTFYVKRSEKMTNFPSVWSLLSIQFDPEWLKNPEDLPKAQKLMDEMSEERLCGAKIRVERLITSGDDPNSPIGCHVFLHLYKVNLVGEPQLNPDYYSDSAWFTAKEFSAASEGQKCGLCTRLWSDHAWLTGVTDQPFIPADAAIHV